MAEIYSKKSDTEVEIRNFETQVIVNNNPTKAIIETVSIPLKDLKLQLAQVKVRNAQLEAQIIDLRAKYEAEETLLNKRIDEAEKLGIVEQVEEKAQ